MKPDDLPESLLAELPTPGGRPSQVLPSAPPVAGPQRVTHAQPLAHEAQPADRNPSVDESPVAPAPQTRPEAGAAAPAAPSPRPSSTSHSLALPPLAPILFELQALALREPRFDTAATTVLSNLAARLRASRVTLATRSSDKESARILASSDGVDSDKRLQAQRRLMNAADEAMDRNVPIEAPQPPVLIQPLPAIGLAHLLRPGEVACVLGLAFELDSGARGALIVELREPGQREQRVLARDAALFVGPILMLKARVEAPLAVRLWQDLRPFDPQTRQHSLRRPVLAGAACGAVLLLLAVWPSTHHVVAQARIEGLGQRIVPAPMDGFLQSVTVRPGEAVKAGQVLAVLDDREAGLQVERTAAERQQLERQYLDALTREDAAATEIARAKLEQARAQDELAKSRLALSQLTAPFDGVLISGDLVSQVGSPVRRGQELMVVAPSKTWRVVAEVDEQDISHIAPGQRARVLLAALNGSSAEFSVSRISPVAQPLDGRNVFEVEGTAEPGNAELRPGLRGVARIEAGQRAPLAVWWERGSHAVRRLLWTLMS